MKFSKRTILYAAYIFGLTLFFLYILFPSEAVKDYMAYTISRGNPDIRVTIDRVSPVLPPGIKLHDVGIAHGNMALIDLDSVKITPGLLSFFTSTKTARFKSRVSAGSVHGLAQIDRRNDRQAEKIEGTISGVQVQGIPALKRLTAHQVSGNLSGDFLIDAAGESRSMTGRLTLSDCRINFDQPVIGQSSLGFSKINADLVLNNGNLKIKKCRARGNQLDADISGTIDLKTGSRRNTLNLNGSVTPHHGLLAKIETSMPADLLRPQKAGKAAIAFKIGGTVQVPEFRLN